MKHRLTASLSLLALLLSPVTQASFADVASTHPNAAAVAHVKSAGIVQGYPDGSFKPSNTINRAEFTKIIIAAEFSAAEINRCFLTTLNFVDVPRDAWFAPYVCVAVANNIIAGYPDGTFQPTWNIKTTEAAKILVQTFGYETTPQDIWYEPFILALTQRGAIPDSVQSLTHDLTRGEMAEMIYRLQQGIASKTNKSFVELTGKAPRGNNPSPASPPAPIEPVITPRKTVFADGTYTAEGSYTSPGGRDTISVTLVVKSDLVTQVTVNAVEASSHSMKHIRDFNGGIGQFVIGQNLEGLASPARVAGSSLTGKGFNQALSRIQTDARN